MRARLLTLLWLLLVWVALWESVTVGTVLGGIAVGLVLTTVFPLTRDPSGGHFRPVAALRFLGYFLWKLVEANAIVAWEVITPSNESVNEGVVAVPITGASDLVITLVANAISLTPGTLTLEIERDPAVLYVHVLHLRTIEQVRLDVLQLEERVLRAFGSEDAIAEMERRLRDAERAAAAAAGNEGST